MVAATCVFWVAEMYLLQWLRERCALCQRKWLLQQDLYIQVYVHVLVSYKIYKSCWSSHLRWRRAIQLAPISQSLQYISATQNGGYHTDVYTQHKRSINSVTSCQWQCSAIRHNCVLHGRQPLQASKSAAGHQLPLKTAPSFLGVTWTVGLKMRRLLRTRLLKCAVVVSCLVLHNVTLYTTFVPVKLCTQTVIY